MPGRLAAGALAGSALVLGGCHAEGSGVDADHLDDALSATFAHLYVRQQQLLGRPPVDVEGLQATGSCDKGGPSVPDVGPGDDWSCVVVYVVDQNGTTAQARYHVEVRPDGSFVADGEGPLLVNEQHTIGAVGGDQVTNPLWQLDGILDPTS